MPVLTNKRIIFVFLAGLLIVLAAPNVGLAGNGFLDFLSALFGQQKSSQQSTGGKPTLYTEPDHCPPCRQLEAQLNARYGSEWQKHVSVSRGSPSGYVPYITDANGQKIDQSQLFAYLDRVVSRGGGSGQPPIAPPSKPTARPTVQPSAKPPSQLSGPKPGSTPWRPVRPPDRKPDNSVLHRLVFNAWLKAAEINPSILYRKEIKVSADGKKLTFKFCELDKEGNEKNCRIVEIKIPNISDPGEYKKFVKTLEDIFGGGSVPPGLDPGKKPPPTKPSSTSQKSPAAKEAGEIERRIEEKLKRLEQLRREQQGQALSIFKNLFSVPKAFAPSEGPENKKQEDQELKRLEQLKKQEAELDKKIAELKAKQPPKREIVVTDRGITVARGKEWYTVETDNAVIHAPTLDPDLKRERKDRKELAENYARMVEKAVTDDCPKEFGCKLPRGSKIEVFLHGSKENYARQSGGPPNSAAHTTHRPGAGGGKVEIDININHPAVEDQKDAVIHESTHAFLYKHFPDMPQWAQEGLAVLSESEKILKGHIKRMLAGLRRDNARPHSAEEIMKLKVGGYGEASLLTKYFTEVLGDKAKFLKFLKRAHQVGNEQALKEVYGIDMKQLNAGFKNWEADYLKNFNK